MVAKHFFIVNPTAAGGRAGNRWQTLEPLIPKYFKHYEIIKTKAPGHGAALAKEISLSETKASIISCGGDGTSNEIINGLFFEGKLLNSEISFGIMPIGSGNDFARSIQFPPDPEAQLACFKEANLMPIKVGLIEYQDLGGQVASRYFMNIFSFGLSGFAGKLINESPKVFGPKVAYLGNTIKAMVKFKPFDLTLKGSILGQIQDEPQVTCDYTGTAMSVVIANGQYFGNNLRIAPQANLDDEAFAIVVIMGMSTPKVLGKFMKVFSGTHLSDPMIKTYQATHLDASTTQGQPVYLDIDGEAIGRLPAKVQTAKDQLKLIVP